MAKGWTFQISIQHLGDDENDRKALAPYDVAIDDKAEAENALRKHLKREALRIDRCEPMSASGDIKPGEIRQR